MQPPKNRLQQKEKHHTSYEVQCFLVENTGIEPVTLLQSMHGALSAELNPHSFGVKKSTTHFCVVLFVSGGDYRDRTGDLLHAMQALSQLS